MSADVSRLIKSTAGGDGQRSPITRDFLGGSFGIESKELDLDLHVPVGWEKRLDLKSGNVYIQRCNNPIIPTTTTTTTTTTSTFGLRNNIQTTTSSLVHDFSFPCSQTQTQPKPKPKQPPSTLNNNSTALTLFDDPTNLELKLVSPATTASAPPSTTTCYQSMCTLDKVKSALDRAWRDPPPSTASSSLSGKKRPSPTTALSCSSDCTSTAIDQSTTTQQGNRIGIGNGNGNGNSNGNGCLMVAAACPCCLLYVLISKANPKCPKCNSFIPSPVTSLIPKKPKIDLNISI